MIFKPHRKHTYRSPRSVTGIALVFICRWRMVSSGMLRRFEGTWRLLHQGDNNRRTRNNATCSLSPWWRRCQVPPKRRFLQEPHRVTSQKTPFFIATAVKTSNFICRCSYLTGSKLMGLCSLLWRQTFYLKCAECMHRFPSKHYTVCAELRQFLFLFLFLFNVTPGYVTRRSTDRSGTRWHEVIKKTAIFQPFYDVSEHTTFTSIESLYQKKEWRRLGGGDMLSNILHHRESRAEQPGAPWRTVLTGQQTRSPDPYRFNSSSDMRRTTNKLHGP
jgi:hypothetical protein